MTQVKLFITDDGDDSVGIFPQTWEVECPFTKEDTEQETLDWFKEQTIGLYKDFCDGKISAYYNFEI